jgi:hypothetical protein
MNGANPPKMATARLWPVDTQVECRWVEKISEIAAPQGLDPNRAPGERRTGSGSAAPTEATALLS